MKKTRCATDDIIETLNHFAAFDYMLDTAEEKLSEKIIKKYHFLLKQGTSQSRLDWFRVGQYKKLPNTIGEMETTDPKKVGKEVRALLSAYHSLQSYTVKDIVKFHFDLNGSSVQDVNGRVGRLIMFREMSRARSDAFIIEFRPQIILLSRSPAICDIRNIWMTPVSPPGPLSES